MEFVIRHTWDSLPVHGYDHVRFRFSPGDGGMKLEVFAHFFDDPPAPPSPPGMPYPGLWNYEVVECFFLDSTTDKYLEVELCPHGQNLVVLLSGQSHAFMECLPLSFKATVHGHRWRGEALIPWKYFPPNVNKMNCYSIHGSNEARTYEALYPVPREDLVEGQKPNFHLLEYFQDFRLQSFMGEDWVQPESDLWKGKC